MDKGLRVVGFTFSNHGESTLTSEVANAKLQTQRSLLSELLAIHATEGDDGMSSHSGNADSDEDDDDDYVAGEEEPAPVATEEALGLQRSEPITIPCAESFANQRAKDAYRRLFYQRRVEQLYYQQQVQLQYQAQQQFVIQQQRYLYQQEQERSAHLSRQKGQECDVGVQARGQNAAVPVY